MSKVKYFYFKHYEPISYLFWGVMATVVSWGSYSAFAYYLQGMKGNMELFGVSMPIVVCLSNVLSWICAFTLAFFANKMWVFRSKSWKKSIWIPEFVKFFSARAVTGIMEIVAVPMVVGLGLNATLFGIEGLIAKILVSVVLVILNYIFSKIFIFRKS